jgi:flagellar basal body rod protein FlgG
VTDFTDGALEAGSSPQDAGIIGKGFFAVEQDGKTLLTRDGRFALDKEGNLRLANSSGPKVLDPSGRAIRVDGTQPFSVGNNGEILQKGQAVGQLGLYTVPDAQQLNKVGANLFSYPDAAAITATQGNIKGGMIERSNVEPSTEMSALMETQRILEANANMIRYQDQMLSRLCTDVGKIS